MEAKKIIRSFRARREYFPYFVLFLGIILTVVTAQYLYVLASIDDKGRFQNGIQRTRESIQSRIDTYIALLRAGSGLFAGSELVTRAEFGSFASTLSLSEHYQGVQGIGYARRIPSAESGLIVQEIRDQGLVDFTITPGGVRDEYYPIVYLEPQGLPNSIAIGYDMYQDPIRKIAMDRARDSTLPSASGRVTLIQERVTNTKQAGFLIYVPVYAGGVTPTTVEERRRLLSGFIYSPFRAGDLLQNIYTAEHQGNIRLSVYDQTMQEESQLYTSTKVRDPEKNRTPMLASTVPITIAGREWLLSFETLPEFEHASETRLVPYVLFFGILASVMLFILTKLQIAARRKAILLAEDLLVSDAALRKSNMQTTNILESITDGFIAFDRSWKINYINSEAAKTFGRKPKEMIGKNFFEDFPDFLSNAIGKALSRSMRERKHMAIEEFYTPTSQWLSMRLYPSRSGVSMYFQNITDRIRLERQKDEFLGIASHELKTPVTSLKSYAQVLHRRFVKKGDHESAMHLLKMDNQLTKLTALISDLLDVTKIQAGKMQLNYTLFTMSSVISEITEELQRTTDQHEITIKGIARREVYGDRERVGQVLSNLLSNAIKYSPDATKIAVTVQELNDTVRVCVRDYGVGIEKQHLNKVFKRFFRVAGPKQETFPGLGLGLYISSEIIRRQGGKIWVESAQGKGSTFCFSIPLAKK